MTKLFEDRERAAEWAFAHAEEVRFLAHCAALKTLGEYAAARMGRSGDEATAYAQGLVDAAVEGVRDEALIERVRAELEARGIMETADALRARMAQALARAALDRPAS